MTPERWKQIDHLLQEALERELAERAAFLEQACGGDDELRREVESLIGFHVRGETFIETPPAVLAAALLAEKEWRAGQRIGHYEIVREIGRGGMGKVYLARDTELGRQVALKLLLPRFTEDAERVRRLRQEARVASALNHPNIIVIYEIGETSIATGESGRAHFIATEFIEGRTLGELIRSGEMKLGEALEAAMQVASALSTAHAAGIVHRDIKPENIMLRPDGYVKVLDFGLAKLTEGQRDGGTEGRRDIERGATSSSLRPSVYTSLTDPGTVLGTISYMSPEQARGFETDARSDIFSLGVVLYEMITGRRPFEGETTADVIASLLGQKPLPLAEDAPAGLQRLVDRMLAKDCAGRFQTAEELRRALKELKQRLSTPGDYTTREFNSLARLARRLGFAGAGDVATMETAESPARVTSGASLFISRLLRSPLRKAVALATLVLALTGVILGWQWLASRGAPINSIAVLPFANAGTDPQTEYLSDGITESLMQNLSQLPELRVMARGTVFTYKGREVDPRQVGAALNVRAVVTGRVEQRGDGLIIAVELADARDGARIWGEQWRRPTSDIITVQEEIVRAVAHHLNLKLSSAGRLTKHYTGNPAAYQLYAKGRHYFFQLSRAGLEKAREYFQQAVAADPNYALAYTGIADVYGELSGQFLEPGEAMPKAKEAALKAVALDETLAEARHSLALIKWWNDWDWPGAEQQFQRALNLNPNAAWTYRYYAYFLLTQKRFDEALVEARLGYELDPLSAPGDEMMSWALFFLGRYDQAIEQLRKSLELNPNYIWTYHHLAFCFARQGKYESAIAALRQGLAVYRHDRLLAMLGYIYAISGRRDEALQTLTELEQEARRRRVSPVYVARVYAGLGDKERTLDLLYQGYSERSDHLLTIGIDPVFEGLRAEPRFVELMRRVGLP
ncbi:MAG TPA: protein kinase [Blastocatellia bacterium]|nr:protein kinase [Blastocatellia bacterium]